MADLLPDVEAIVVEHLTQHVSWPVGTVAGDSLPCVRVSQVSAFTPALDESTAQVQVDCWASDGVTASGLARSVIASLDGIRGEYASGYCAGAGVSLGPVRIAEPDSTDVRYLVQLTVFVMPSAL